MSAILQVIFLVFCLCLYFVLFLIECQVSVAPEPTPDKAQSLTLYSLPQLPRQQKTGPTSTRMTVTTSIEMIL